MKKLMMTTVALASAAAMASICDPTETTAGCRAYDFSASLKLVDGKMLTTTDKKICGSDTGVAAYRVKASRKLKGLWTDCDTCQITAGGQSTKTAESLLVGEANNGAIMYMATSAKSYKQVFTSKTYDGTLTDHYCFSILNFIGGYSFEKSKVAEGLLQLSFVERDQYDEDRAYSLFCAGFGARDGDLLKNLSGNVAGAVTAANWCGHQTQCFEPCLETWYWTPASGNIVGTDWTDWDTGANATWQGLSANSPAYDAVYGTWSFKYNSSKSKISTSDELLKKTFGSGYTLFTPGATTVTFPFAFPVALQ